MRRLIIGITGAVVVLFGIVVVLASLFVTAARAPNDVGSAPVPSAVDATLAGLDWGQIAFAVAPEMKYHEPHVVELLLSTRFSVEELQAQLQTRAGVQSATIHISDRMEAQLAGQGFSIESIEPPLQAVSRRGTTRWRWEVIPTVHGTHTLHLQLYAHIDVAGLDTPYVLQTYDKPVEVQITVAQRVAGFVGGNWQWLWAAILVPIAGYLWKRTTGRRKRSDPPGTGAVDAASTAARSQGR
jgi:hypothetical protein